MKETLEALWNEYLLEKCAQIDTSQERNLTKKASELHQKANDLLNKEQQDAVQKFVDALYEVDAIFAKKAFFNGCKFAISLLLETENLGK